MKKTTLNFLICGSFLFFCALQFIDADSDLCKSFINSVNDGKNEEAAGLCADSFKVRFSYSGEIKNKKTYFSYLNKKAALKNRMTIDSAKTESGRINLYGKNSSIFNQYLKLHQLPIRYSFLVVSNQLMELRVDSLKGYNDSLRINDRRWDYFEKWVSQKHQGINLYYIKIQYNDSLLNLAKEFYTDAVKK